MKVAGNLSFKSQIILSAFIPKQVICEASLGAAIHVSAVNKKTGSLISFWRAETVPVIACNVTIHHMKIFAQKMTPCVIYKHNSFTIA